MGFCDRYAVALGIAIACIVTPERARAQAPASGAPAMTLDDTAARDVAAKIACSSPKLVRYYGRALDEIARRRWGVLRSALQQATIDLVTDAVYEAAVGGTGEAVTMRGFAGGARAPSSCTDADLDAARAALASPQPASAVAMCSAKPLAEWRRDPACVLAQAVAHAMAGDVDDTQLRLADLVAASSFPLLYDGAALSPARQDSLFEHVDRALRAVARRESGDRTIDDDVERVFARIDLDQVHPEKCDDGDVVKVLAVGATDETDAFCVATRSELDLARIAVVVTTPSGARHETSLARVAEDLVPGEEDGNDAQRRPQTDSEAARELVCSLPLSPADGGAGGCGAKPAGGGGGTFKIAIGALTWNGNLSGKGEAAQFTVTGGDGAHLLALIEGAADADDLRSGIVAFIRDRMLGEAPEKNAIRELAVTALRLRRVADAFGRLPLESDDHAYVVGTVEALPAIAGAARSTALPVVEPPDCARAAHPLARLRCLARPGGALRGVLVDAEHARVRHLAVRVGSAFFPDTSHDACDAAPGKLFFALAAYSLDDGTRASDAQSDVLAAEQLRTASADVQRCTGHRAMYRARVRFDLVPSPAVRISWNNAYRNEAIGDGYRVVPSVDWLAARVRLNAQDARSYAGIQVSLADLAAPFAELSMRRRGTTYDREGAVWLEVLKPRVELMFGIPAESEHVFVSAGLSLRTVAPFDEPGRLTYVTIDRASGDQLASFVEYNAGAKYVF